MSPRRVRSLYIGFQVFFGLLLWLPVFYEFQKQIGLTDNAIFEIQSYYYLAFILFEMPTGFIADRFGYKRCMQAGALVLIATNALPIVIPNYWGLFGHFMLIAAARSLISGAASAYMYEYLDAQGNRQHFKEVEGRARSLGLVAKIIGWSCVGWLFAWNPNSPYWLTCINATVAFGLASLLPQVDSQKVASSVKKGAVGAWLTLLRSPQLALIIVQGTGIFVLVRVLQVNLFQPLLGSKGFDATAFGWMMAVMTLAEAVGAARASKVRDWIPDLPAVFVMTVVLSLSLALVALPIPQTLVIPAIVVFSLAAGVAFPIQRQLTNDAIPAGEQRATLLSIESIINRGFCAIAVAPMGAWVGEGLIREVVMVCVVSTIALVALAYGFLLFMEKKEEDPDAHEYIA